MRDPLYVNGRFTTTDEKVIGVEDRGFQYGDAVYEVLKFLAKKPIFLEDHYRRLRNGLAILDIHSPWQMLEEFASVCGELLARTSAEDGLIYVEITRGECERAHLYPRDIRPTAVAYARRWKFPDAERKRSGIRIVTAPDVRWEHCNVKSVNLLANVFAKQKAMKEGADEAIMIRGREVTEGASANFFGVKYGRIITPPATARILPGTVRDHVISLAIDAGIRVDERPIVDHELFQLDEAFVTSTSQGVMPVSSIDGRSIGSGRRGVITERLQRAFDDLEAREAGLPLG